MILSDKSKFLIRISSTLEILSISSAMAEILQLKQRAPSKFKAQIWLISLNWIVALEDGDLCKKKKKKKKKNSGMRNIRGLCVPMSVN